MSRASFIVPVAVIAATIAGPLAGIASASPQVDTSKTVPAEGTTYTQSLPAIRIAFNEPIMPVTGLPGGSSMTVHLNGGVISCPASVVNQNTLTCTPAGGFFDGLYRVDYTANPGPGATDIGSTTSVLNFALDATPAAQLSLSPADNAALKSATSVVATYGKVLQAPGAGSQTGITVELPSGDPQNPTVIPGSTSLASNGTTLTWTPATALTDGIYTVIATAQDYSQYGGGQVRTTTTHFTVDSVPPATPGLTLPAYVNSGDLNAVPVSGTALDGAGPAAKVQLTVSDGTTTAALPDVTTIKADGSWSATPDLSGAGLSDGPLTFTATAVDLAGNVSDAATAGTTKDTVAPNTPSIALDKAIVNASSSTIGVTGATTADSLVDLAVTQGTTPPADADWHPATVDGSGNFAGVLDTTALADGTLTVTARATDAAGNTTTNTTTIGKDTGVPASPAINPVTAANAGNVTALPISGTVADDDIAKVTVWVSDSAGGATTPFDVVPAGDKSWSTNVDVSSLADGLLTVHATATDTAGNATAVEGTADAMKDTGVPVAPAFTPAQYVNANSASQFVLSGTAEPGATVNIAATDGTTTVTPDGVTVLADGTWTKSLDLTSLTDGTVTFTVKVVDAAGNVSDPTSHTATKDTVAPTTPDAPVLTIDGPGNAVTATGSGTAGDKMLLRLSTDAGDATATSLVDIDGTGHYTGQLDSTLVPDGTIAVTAAESDAAGNVSPASAAGHIVKDTIALALLSTSPADAADQRSVTAVSGTFNERLDLAGSSVTLTSGGVQVPTDAAQLSADGKTISVAPTTALAEGSYTVQFQVKDFSDAETVAPTTTFVVDHTAPAAPATSTLSNADASHPSTVTVTGTAAEAGGAVTVTVADSRGHQVTQDAVMTDKAWTATVVVASLADGALHASAMQTDAAGNASAASGTVDAMKDTVAPVVTMNASAPFSLGSLRASWSARDAVSGVATYDVRYARATHGHALGAFAPVAGWQGLPASTRAVTKVEASGVTGCFEVRAHDAFGNVSGWTATPQCSTVALDDRSLSTSTGWTRGTGSGFYRGTLTTTTLRGAKLALAASQLDRVALVATECPSCGSVLVTVGSWHATVNLSSSAVHRHVLITLPAFSLRTAKVVLTVTSSGKRVQIDGLGTRAV